MSKFYIQDSTIGRYVTFDSVPQLVNYFNILIPRAFKLSRQEYVQNLLDLGYGYDDADGVMLTRAISEEFNIGVVREDGAYVRTDVHNVSSFPQKEYGD